MGKSIGDEFFDKYKAKLQRAKEMAFVSNVMYGLNWFLGFCALTWASAVILGGLLTALTRHDYYSVVALLLLEAVRLASTTFFGKLVTLKLVHGSADPHRLVYNNATKQNLLGLVRILEQAVQLMVLTISILVPIRRLLDLNVVLTTVELVEGFDGLKTSLRIFYLLVLVNSSIAVGALLYSKHVVPLFLDSVSLRMYYEKIVWKGMDEGLLHATDFDFLSWTFQMQADEYRRNMRAFVVMNLHGDMMKFLYYHPNYKGFEAAKMALDSTDTYEREAAANIVGLWVTLVSETEGGASGKGQKTGRKIDSASSNPEADAKGSTKPVISRLLMQTKLLAKLAEVLDNDESGRAATLSFVNLAESDPKSVLMVRSEEKDEKVADILMDQIHKTVELGRPNNALMYIKAMIPLLSYLDESVGLHECMTMMNGEAEGRGGNIKHRIDKCCTPAKLQRLKEDMWRIVSENARGLKRLQTVAVKSYLLFLSEDERKDDQRIKELRTYLRESPIGEKDHILKDEYEYLLEVLGEGEMLSWKDRIKLRPLERGPTPLPLLAWRPMSLICVLVSIIIVVISSIFIMKYAHF